MKKRLLALFLAFVMAMSLLPVSVFADGGTGGQLQGTKDNPITASKDGVTVNKYVSVDEEGNYSLTLEAYAENKVTSTTTTTPWILSWCWIRPAPWMILLGMDKEVDCLH